MRNDIMGDIIGINGIKQSTPDEILQEQIGKLKNVIVIGVDHDSNFIFDFSSEMTEGNLVYIMKFAQMECDSILFPTIIDDED